ncbi:MAG: glutamate-5-semialdehyde dehydrogenase [Candidatus Margulisiibacteriota bacterium]
MSNSEILTKAHRAKAAAFAMATIGTSIKNAALDNIAAALEKYAADILAANAIDMEAGEKKELSRALLDRLALDGKRIKAMAEGIQIVKKLPDPIGETIAEWKRPNGLKIKKVRVPLGVIAIIYEARPNVTVDAATLCLKAGNATILRGGSDAIQTNVALAKIISEAAYKAGIPEGAIELIEDTNRETVKELLQLREYIDVVIPRGGKELIQMVVTTSSIPAIETGEGNCHAYIEKTADLEMAARIIINAKCDRPSVCNAIESLLVDEAIADQFLPVVLRQLKEKGVEIRGCEKTCALCPDETVPATETDWKTEFLALILAVKVVKNVDEAITHINRYGTKHSETIVTRNRAAAEKFKANIDAAAVYVNASTRFTDGFEFGFGAEIGISTQKLHARGPMGLPELTSYKYLVEGNGQVR